MIKLLIYCLYRIFNGPKKNRIIPTITDLYRRYIGETFKVKTEIIKVKKGKVRYILIFYHLNSGGHKFYLSRNQKRLEGII